MTDGAPRHSQSDLPYVEAVIKEVLRWKISSPLAIPHRVKQEDEYEGEPVKN
jgi:cytochrome P450